MRNNAKTLGWGLALAAVAAVITAGTVYAASGAKTASTELSMAQMSTVLVPLQQQPESRYVSGPMTFKEAAAANAFAAPPSMEFSSKACATYLEDVLGPMESIDGWIQFGSRVDDDHNDNFIQAVVTVPGGADAKLIERIREAVFACKTGTLTLEGTVKGDITYTERKPLDLPGATVLSLTGQTKFSEKPGTEGYKIVSTYEMPPSAQLLVDSEQECIEQVNIVASGSTLMVTMEADLELSNKIATAMYEQVQQLS